MASDFRNAVQLIQEQLRAADTEPGVIERCGMTLSQIGTAAAAEIEYEFCALVDAAEAAA